MSALENTDSTALSLIDLRLFASELKSVLPGPKLLQDPPDC